MAKEFYKIKKGLNLEPQASAPLSPQVGDMYMDSSLGLQLYSNGIWSSPAGAGSGSGELNLIENSNDANQNWFISAGTGDLSFSTTLTASELPLEGIVNSAIKLSCSVSGTKYIYTRFKTPDTLLTAKQKFEWYQKALSGLNTNEWKVELWWNSNSSYSGTWTEFPLKNDISSNSFLPNLNIRYYNQWTGTSAAQYLELRIMRASGSGLSEWALTNIIAGPGIYYVDMADLSPQMAGSIIPYSGPTTGFTSVGSDGTTLLTKNGWALCNGASISQSLYSQLFTNIGTTWDTAARQDGTGGNYSAPSGGFFRIPDLRGVFLRGVGTSSRADGSGDVVKTLAQFNNDTTAPNGTTANSSTTTSNTDLAHTHASTGLTVSGTNVASSISGTAALTGSGTLTGHSHSASDSGHTHYFYDNTAGFGPVRTNGQGTNPVTNHVTSTGYANITVGASNIDHTHSVSGTAVAQSWSGSVAGSTANASTTMNHAHTASTSTTLSSTDLETAPRNTGVNYLIKLYDAQSVNVFNSQAASPFKAGFVVSGAQATAPAGWLLCGGQEVSRATYAELFTAIGTTYGAGNGSTTFNIPDLRGRVVAGKDNMDGTPANRITVGISGITGTTLGAAGGSEAMYQHSHTVTGTTNIGHTHASSGVTGSVGGSDGTHSHTASSSSSSSQDAHNHTVSIGYTYDYAWEGVTTRGHGGNDYIDFAIGRIGSGFTGPYTFTSSGASAAGVYTSTTTTVNTTNSGHGHGHSLTATGQTLGTTNIALASGTAANAGTGTSQNVQPTLILNYFIKAFNDTIDVSGFNEASPTSTGFMTNSAQSIGGLKNFVDGIQVPFVKTGAPNVLTGAGTVSSGGVWIMDSASSFTAAVITAVGNDGLQIIIKNINTGIVTVDPNGSQTIDGISTVNLNQYDSITITAYNGNWYLI